ncbi:MAG: zf-HC2 domain-containing protein [Phycisphaeraceae bacterium]
MPPIRKLLTVLSLTCDASSRLLSDRFEHELHRIDNTALRLHLMTCTGCRRTRTHFQTLHELNQHARHAPTPTTRLPIDARQRIARSFEQP